MSDFGELRALLQRPPSQLRFRRIADLLLEAWRDAPERTQEERLPYALNVLERWPDALRSPGPSWLRTVIISAPLSPLWKLAKHLDFTTTPLLDEHWLRLASSPQVRHITSINAAYSQQSPQGLRSLITSRNLTSLTHLDLSYTGCAPSLHKLPDAPWWPNLTMLGLNDLIKPHISTGPLFEALKAHTKLNHLKLAMSELGAQPQASSKLLGAIERLKTLDRLELSYLRADDETRAALGHTLTQLPQLTGLDLSGSLASSQAQADHEQLIRAISTLTNLKQLSIQHNAFNSLQLHDLLNVLQATPLQQLDLSGHTTLPEVMAHISHPTLSWLGVMDCEASVEQLAALLQAEQRLPKLETLRIEGSKYMALKDIAATRAITLGLSSFSL